MPRDAITTDRPSATRKPAILSAIHREAPALVVFSLVVLLSVPLFEGLARGDELIEELEEVRTHWFVSAATELYSRDRHGGPPAGRPPAGDPFEDSRLSRISRFSPELRSDLNELQALLGAPVTLPTMLRTQAQFTEVREVMVTLESGRNYAYQSLLLFLMVLVLAFIVLQRIQAARLRAIQREHRDRLLMEQLAAQVQEQERHRIARELHDRTAQTLALARILADRIPPGENAERLRSTVSRAMEDIRAVSHRLRPAQNWSEDAAEMIRELCARVEKDYSLSCHLSVHGNMGVDWDDDVFLHLQRIIGEALVNVARHAETEQAWVRVESGDDHSIRIRVHDHGRGMGSAPEGLGRRGIRERAELTGAKLRWFEPEGGGTGLEVNVARHRRIRKGRDANSTG